MNSDNKLAKETSEETKEQWVAPKATMLSTQETMGGSNLALDGVGSDEGGGGSS